MGRVEFDVGGKGPEVDAPAADEGGLVLLEQQTLGLERPQFLLHDLKGGDLFLEGTENTYKLCTVSYGGDYYGGDYP